MAASASRDFRYFFLAPIALNQNKRMEATIVAKFVWLTVVSVLFSSLTAIPASADDSSHNPCLYPTQGDRFGITVSSSLDGWDVRPLSAGSYHNWGVNWTPSNVQGMRYYPVIHVTEAGYSPNRDSLVRLIPVHRGATWLVGNEVDTVWMGNVRPETYIRHYHEIYHLIKSLDPTARVGFNGFSTVSTLRLAWLDRAWAAYRARYGTDIPVDVWNIHGYVVNEMVHEWGPQIPPGIDNAVGYTENEWTQANDPAASGGTVHQSDKPGARAYFAVHGDSLRVYLRTGPDSGMADIFLDNRGMPPNPPNVVAPVERVDLYAPVPGTIIREYANLPAVDPRLAGWHHVRVQVTGLKNPASTGYWVRVDAAEAASTSSLPTGRLEDDNPLVARIILTTAAYADIERLHEELRMFRRWMLDHGQRDKPLINSEFGILLGENLGFTYPRVRDYMLASFDLFLNRAIDPELGYPADGNRLLQEWFWFVLAEDYFNGARIHTALYDRQSRTMLPLGQDFANYLRGLSGQYADLEVLYFRATPTWPLFSGERSRVRVEAAVRNRGQQAVGPFRIRLADGATPAKEWQVPGLSGREGSNNTFTIDYVWEFVAHDDLALTLTADSAGQVDEPCDPNNSLTVTLSTAAQPDLALDNVTVVAGDVTPLAPGQTTLLALRVDVSNLSSSGVTSDHIPVTLWRVDSAAGRVLLDTEQVSRGSRATAGVTLEWAQATAGPHDLILQVGPVAGESNTSNNEMPFQVLIPSQAMFFPFVRASWLSQPGPDAPLPFGGSSFWPEPH